MEAAGAKMRNKYGSTSATLTVYSQGFDFFLRRVGLERERIEQDTLRSLEDVVSLDHDRILRSYLTFIKATLRTNYFQTGQDGGPKPYISLKLHPEAIPELPEPRPARLICPEVFMGSGRLVGQLAASEPTQS